MKPRITILLERLEKVERQLEKVRGCSPLTHGWQTQRYSRADRNWDYYAQERMRILNEIENQNDSETN